MFRKHVILGGLARVIFFTVCFMFSSELMAASPTLGTIKTNVSGSIKNLLVILQDIAMLAGVGFIIASFFKFHQHKMNPTQVPLSQGVTLLLVGAGLTAFPNLISTATQSAFGVSAGTGSLTGFISS